MSERENLEDLLFFSKIVLMIDILALFIIIIWG